MCGINGIITLERRKNDELLNIIKRMNKRIAHRGPDNDGVWNYENIYLGHRRLSVIDVSSSANQPMVNSNNDLAMVFNGEIYNFKKLKEKVYDYKFISNSDTEVILALIDKLGFENAVRELDGMFAIAVYSKRYNRIYLARDRVGEKPLYFYSSRNQFCFSSELTSLLEGCFEKQNLSRDNINNYFKYGYFLGETTPFTEIYKLLPGHTLTIEIGTKSTSLEFKKFYSPNERQPENNNYQSQLADLEKLIYNSVEEKLNSDVPLGCFLSGGIDSSLITAVASEIHSGSIDTFSIGFENPSFDESRHAEKISRYLGCNPHILTVNDEILLENALSSTEYLSEPISNPSSIPTYILSKYAKSRATVCLAGDGGDELFLGYNRYTHAFNIYNKFKNLPQPIKKSITRLTSISSKINIDRIINSMYLIFGKKGGANYSAKIKKIGDVIATNSLSELYSTLMSVADLDPRKGMPFSKELYLDKNYDFENCYLSAAMQWDQHHYLPEDCLAKTDRMSMANSLEVRLPLISNDLLNFSCKTPISSHYNDYRPKALLRDLLKKKLPTSLYERPKMGFTVPIKAWVSNQLKSEVDRFLNEESIILVGVTTVEFVNNLKKQNNEKSAHALWAIYIIHKWLLQNSDNIDFTKNRILAS